MKRRRPPNDAPKERKGKLQQTDAAQRDAIGSLYNVHHSETTWQTNAVRDEEEEKDISGQGQISQQMSQVQEETES